MKLNDERRKRLTEYLGLCWHEGRMPINCGYRCVKCGDTYVVNRTFTTDADMMALFRKMVDKEDWYNFSDWARYGHTTFSQEDFDELSTWLFYEPERFCCLVAEWLKCRSVVSYIFS